MCQDVSIVYEVSSGLNPSSKTWTQSLQALETQNMTYSATLRVSAPLSLGLFFHENYVLAPQLSRSNQSNQLKTIWDIPVFATYLL